MVSGFNKVCSAAQKAIKLRQFPLTGHGIGL
jgi:hypothetical protein